MLTNRSLLATSVVLLASCGGGGSGPNTPPAPPQDNGTLTVTISDAPMDDVDRVWLSMGELVMTDEAGIEHRHAVHNGEFDLLRFQGMDSHPLVSDLDLPAGHYHNVHLTLHPGTGNQGSAVENGQGRHGLSIQSGYLPMADLTVMSGQHLVHTIDVDLYRGMFQTSDGFELRHRGISSVNYQHMGHLIGEMDPQWVADCEMEFASLGLPGATFKHLAYLYPEGVTDIGQMADSSVTRNDQRVPPVAVSPVFADAQGDWHFVMGFLSEGHYRVGYSCLGHLDDPQADDINGGQFVIYRDGGTLTVSAGDSGGHQNVHQCGNGHAGGGHGGHGG
ncbi:DUF4382 domain-containing protein [Ferrimonas sediminicola]|uniref:DUF4382 domain-containing protein n=1 Tax=Ferrimonas sediminicola TaxID=2569538 RepID=A0A4U1BH04_9GAMM|nr:DUF4382 domain-containing protein [Ferrimonas sediminicola]TKB50525.1 DUF4382 domain-containing protein [Ferrimonas sediminicola]